MKHPVYYKIENAILLCKAKDFIEQFISKLLFEGFLRMVHYEYIIVFHKFNMAYPIWRSKRLYGVINFKIRIRGFQNSTLRIYNWFSQNQYGGLKVFIE